VIEQCTTIDEALQWSITVCGTVDNSKTEIREIVQEGYVSEVKETFTNFRDSGMLDYY
jgi:hypothetical protein